jgi:sugar phosphate isomerase/epimerase
MQQIYIWNCPKTTDFIAGRNPFSPLQWTDIIYREEKVMVEFGRILWRGLNEKRETSYDTEIEFCKKHGFGCMQITYRNGSLQYDALPEPKETAILEAGFPIIIHAIFDIEDYEKYAAYLLRLLKFLKHKEVIIHPYCEPSAINRDTIYKLSECNKKITNMFLSEKITVYIENCARAVPLNYLPEDLKIVFSESPATELILDLAHIDDYDHLRDIITVKYPKMLHIADRRFSVGHEHLPIGMGDLDFELIFMKYLNDFSGKIILEISEDENVIIDSMSKIKKDMKYDL